MKPYNYEHERQRLIRLIHVGKRDLNMDDDTYRSVLLKIGNQNSCKSLSVPKLEQVLEHMKRAGYVVRSKNPKNGKTGPGKPALSRPLALDQESKKIRALWLFLHETGIVKNSSEAALAAYVKRITKVDALQWLDGDQSHTVIETLKKWAMRNLPRLVWNKAEAFSAKVKSGELRVSLDDLQEINSAVQTAVSRNTFDPMKDAWLALHKVLK